MHYKKLYLLLYLINLFFLSLINNLNAQIFQSDNQDWSVEIKYIEPGTVNLYASTSDDSKIIGHYYYFDKILVITDKNDYVKFGWAKVIYPKEGFLIEKNLITTEKKRELDIRYKNNPDEIFTSQSWQPYIIKCDKDFSFVKKENDFNYENIGILREGDEVLCISSDGIQNKEWIKIVYPKQGYVFSEELALTSSKFILGIGASYGFLNIPYEKELENYKNPIGGFIELTKSNWDFLFRIGYTNYQSHLKEYILKNEIFFLHIQYSLFRFINNHFRIYALIGGGYWQSKFQFTKYPTLTSYYPEESNKGFGYYLGGGIEYTLSNFFLGIQYSFLGTEEAKFGPDPIDGEFTNQYKLFIGSNQIEVNLGYRFEF
ncbi:MAG: hypothetical protein KKF21_15350 [Bacteroidetes bacterium]|nr:hypothetical protein [Bacteroidota bacterium]